MKLLFIGGTGIISSACAALAVERGHDLDLLVRGSSSSVRPPPPQARILKADIRSLSEAQSALRGKEYDAVVDFVAFTEEHIETDLELFRNITGQFVFISSASAYHKPVRHLPITESTPLHNPFWQYSRDKIACEKKLFSAYQAENFPATIVRPSHTYDKTLMPLSHGGTVLHRLLKGKPIIVHGDGTSLWTLTHHADFAVGLLGLLGSGAALGEAFHITGDEALPWNEITHALARALGVKARIVHVPSDKIAERDPDWGASLLGDKSHSALFDNSKVKRLVPDFRAKIPFAEGAREIVAYHQAHPELMSAQSQIDAVMDSLATEFEVHEC